jgi:hypothetical protein
MGNVLEMGLTHLSFGLGHPLVPGALRLTRGGFAPDNDCDARVSVDEDKERHDVLETQQTKRVHRPRF